MKFLPALAVGMLLASGCAVADCTNPAGDAGHVIFNTTVKAMQYCDGTSWINAGAVIPNAPQTGCTSPSGVAGQIIYANNLGVVQFCNGSSWVDTACAAGRKPNGSGCGGKPAGTIQYAANHNELQFCDSTDWVAMGWGCAGGSGPVIPAEQEVMAYVSSSTNNLVISSLFDGGDWADGSKRKKLIINSGVTVGSTAAGTPALRTGTGRVHSLIIVNNGTIAGAGGAANGGVGGNALLVEQVSVTVLNSGTLAGGGGGGGKGGTGGSGSVREPATGESYKNSNPWTMWALNYNSGTKQYFSLVYWNSSTGELKSVTGNVTSMVHGAYTYYRGTQKVNDNPGGAYGIYRVLTAPSIGGAGGNGGRGQGSDGAATAGLTGAVGGTNAGAGGTGGAGGAYGAAGAAGGTGTAGNASSGLAGSAGGAAGGAITGSGYILTNTGTVLGSY